MTLQERIASIIALQYEREEHEHSVTQVSIVCADLIEAHFGLPPTPETQAVGGEVAEGLGE